MELLTPEHLFEKMKTRRSCRRFSSRLIDIEQIKTCLAIAGSAPSGANAQPWFFSIVISSDIKQKIRVAAEDEERKFYQERASERFLKDLKPLQTNWEKPHLEEAAALIVIFQKSQNESTVQVPAHCYYPKESVGIATGFLITALHMAGYATLTHTPAPMSFLNQILQRPYTDRPFMILAVGHPCPSYQAPKVYRKSLDEISSVF